MKAFRGTLIALVLFLLAFGTWWAMRPPELTPKEKKALREKEQGIELFTFEKSDLTKVEVKRPDGTLIISEHPDAWYIEGENLRASRNMVNKFKHQLHDLVARATVADAPSDPALYGLGESAVVLTLTFRDGSTRQFKAGDPNPSGVSFYIQLLPEGTVYTVKKSAVDFYTLSLSEFRERRFATFDSKDVDVLEAVQNGVTLRFQRTGEHSWDMLSPKAIPASDDEVRSLMGRVSAMKAIQFISESGDLGQYGLDHPRLKVSLSFSGKDPIVLTVGNPTGEKDGEYTLSYAKLDSEPSIYAVRDGLLEDYAQDPENFRLRRFARVDANDVEALDATYTPVDAGDQDLAGTVIVKMAADMWSWYDGLPVPGSTPRRLATRAAGITAESFVAESGEDTAYGFDKPVARVVMTAKDNVNRTLVLGKPADPVTDPEGHEQKRRYARLVEFPEIYIIDDGVLDVVRDLMREHGRHARGEEEKDERKERVEKEQKAE